MIPLAAGRWTNLKLELAQAARRSFGLQAEVLFFSSLWLDGRRPGAHRYDPDPKFHSSAPPSITGKAVSIGFSGSSVSLSVIAARQAKPDVVCGPPGDSAIPALRILIQLLRHWDLQVQVGHIANHLISFDF